MSKTQFPNRSCFQHLKVLIPILCLGSCARVSAQQSEVRMLTGLGKDDAVPWDFFCTAGRGSGVWTKIPVPSSWELQGFGIYNYGRSGPKKPTVEGKYKRSFQVPAAWARKRVFVVFDGAQTDTSVSINGRSAGETHQGGFYQFRHEITTLLHFDKPNLIEADVTDESAEQSVNQAERQGDYWNFGGIFRPVYLEAFPQEFAERVAVDAGADGKFSMEVFPSGVAKADSVEARIYDTAGKEVGEAFSAQVSAGVASVKLETVTKGPRLWTAETPDLYEVRVRLKQGKTVVHELRKHFGFRTFEVRAGDGIYLNGRRILLKGVDRHSFWPDSGRTLSPKMSDDDIALIKEMNMNAVRMSHYPPDAHFLDKCDEKGLYVLDELGGWHQHYATEVGQKLVREMVTRDVNHPCILFWDNGNEGGWNTALDGEFAKYDPQQRHVLHPWEKSGGVDTKHYPLWPKLNELAAAGMIWMPTEFLHALDDGGGGAGLDDYWNLMRQSSTCAGGFIWALVDEGVRRTDDHDRIDTQGNLAPDGLVGPHREKEGSFYTVKEIWSPVVVAAPVMDGKFDGTLAVENRYDFTNLKQCKFTWQLRRFSPAAGSKTGFAVTAEGRVESPMVAARESGNLKLGLPSNWAESDALSVQAVGPDGRELWRWVWPIAGPEKSAAVIVTKGKSAVTSTEDADSISLTSGDLVVRISRASGELAAVTRKGRPFSLNHGPLPVAGDAVLKQVAVREDENDKIVECSYDGALNSVRWTLHPGGWLTLGYEYTATGEHPFLGVTFSYPEAKVRDLKWLGNGPYRVYKNRLKGGILNVWQNKPNDTVTGRSWNYPEFRGYFSDVRWAAMQTDEGPITMVIHDAGSYFRFLTPTYAKDSGKATAVYPAGDISFLQAIPAIGTKFSSPKDMGPQSGLTVASGTYRGTVDFRFGNP